ncbi:MAG TPA: oxygenase MpaB family protein, partial [Vicinamibacterales bacterium]|nr:oxygenase MpaB family protein [Vicinamibacterales bacterium]
DMVAGGTIAVTDTSRSLAHALLFPPGSLILWPALRPARLITFALLPPQIRAAYGFRWDAREARAFARWTAFLRTAVRLLPRVAREWPAARRLTAAASAHAWSGTGEEQLGHELHGARSRCKLET